MKMEGGRKEEQAMKKLRELLLEDVGVEVMSVDGGRCSRVTKGQSRPSVLLFSHFPLIYINVNYLDGHHSAEFLLPQAGLEKG